MTILRQEKIKRIAEDIPEAEVFGESKGKVLVVGWGGTYGAIHAAVDEFQKNKKSVSACHIHYMNPFPKNVGQILKNFETILVPEINTGQLLFLLRSQFPGIQFHGYNRVTGQPFKIKEIKQKIEEFL